RNIAAPANAIKKDDGVQWSGTLTPSLAPTIDSLTDVTGNGPAGGYLPLAALGVDPIADVGDDTMQNFNVPAFFYGSESYTRIGVRSDGFLILGGATDTTPFPQRFPNPNRPNNVIAPFWTDLNPAEGGSIRIGLLTDDSAHPATAHNFLVIDWFRVKNFSNDTTHSGEVWFALDGAGNGTGP